jgi:hypothetical protein
MRIRAVLVLAAAALGSACLPGASASSTAPYLRSLSVSNRHVVAFFRLGELAPGRILVAVKPQTTSSGEFVKANVRLNEGLRVTKTATGFRARTRHALRPGRYYVEVSGVVLGVDCTPKKPCPARWSNIRRVRIRR